MPRNSNDVKTVKSRDPRTAVRVVLGTLLAANLVAAGLILFPPGGSAEALARQMAALQVELATRRAAIAATRQHAMEVEEGRAEGDKFVADYFLPLRTSDHTLDSELQRAAAAAKIKPKGTSFAHELIEGSNTLQMVSVTATFEGTYNNVVNFVHSIDQSPLLLIIDSLSAVPQQGSNTLSVSLKIDAFVRSGEGEE
jgi:hypothetical protein